MSYSFTAASSHSMTRTAGTPFATYSRYVIAWVKVNDNASDKHVFSSYSSTNTADRYDIRMGSGEACNVISRTSTGPTETLAQSTLSGMAGVWHLVHGEWTADNARRSGADGSNYATSSGSITLANTPNRVRLGLSGAGTSGYDGLIGLVAVYSTLSDADRTELVTKAPLAASSAANLLALWDLRTDQGTSTIVDPIGGYNLTISGATFNSDNPTLVDGAATKAMYQMMMARNN